MRLQSHITLKPPVIQKNKHNFTIIIVIHLNVIFLIEKCREKYQIQFIETQMRHDKLCRRGNRIK